MSSELLLLFLVQIQKNSNLSSVSVERGKFRKHMSEGEAQHLFGTWCVVENHGYERCLTFLSTARPSALEWEEVNE